MTGGRWLVNDLMLCDQRVNLMWSTSLGRVSKHRRVISVVPLLVALRPIHVTMPTIL